MSSEIIYGLIRVSCVVARTHRTYLHIHTSTHRHTAHQHPLLHHTLLGLHHSHCLALRIIHPPHHHNITIISTTTASFIIVWRLPSLSFHLAPQAASTPSHNVTHYGRRLYSDKVVSGRHSDMDDGLHCLCAIAMRMLTS